jgi:hypothetical protein
VQVAVGQGLNLSPTKLSGASNIDLAPYEEALVLSADFTGAKTRPKRNPRSKAAFGDVQSLAELQLASYHLASAPAIYSNDNTKLTPGSLSYVPRVRDQRECSTCVGHAVASAVEAAAGAATRRAAGTWNVSPQSLYYCRWVLTQEAWPGGLPVVMCQNFLQQLTKLISTRGQRHAHLVLLLPRHAHLVLLLPRTACPPGTAAATACPPGTAAATLMKFVLLLLLVSVPHCQTLLCY